MKTPARSIILCGIKHCGKSTQGKRIASALGLDFYDTDDLIFEQTGMDARALYKSQGKDAFIAAELRACEFLRDKLSGKGTQAVIATGGGICQNDPAMQILKALGLIVYLEIDEKSAADRIIREARFLPDGRIENLPAYIAAKNPSDEAQARAIFHDFYLERTQKYKSLADVSVKMQGSRDENTKKILSALGLEH